MWGYQHRKAFLMHISEVIARKGIEVHAVGHQSKLSQAIETMVKYTIGSVIVSNENSGEMLGLISQAELLAALRDFGSPALDHCATGIMRKPAPACRPDDDVASVLRLMTSSRSRHMVVTDDIGTLHGIISIGDLVAAQLAEARLEAGVLRDMARSRLMSA